MPFRKNWIVIFFLISACQTAPKNFVSQSESLILHKPTGVEYPKIIEGWEHLESQTRENLSPEILAELKYISQVSGRDFQPRVEVFFMKGTTTANLQMIENREAKDFQKAQKLNSDLGLKLPSQRKVFMSSYNHQLSQTVEAGGAVIIRETPLISIFAQSAKNPQLVFLITSSQKQKEDQKMAFQFMDDFLLK
jgi:hypothetical protein